MPVLTDEDKVIRNDVGKRIAAAIEELSAPEAEKVSYDNTESGMTADNAQDAIDELKSDIDSVELADLDDVNLTSPQDEDELHYDSATSKWKNIAKKIYEKSASGSLVLFNDGGDNIPLKSLIANITAVQSGSGTPSPSNIRSISGWSGANISSRGKNVLNYNSWKTVGIQRGTAVFENNGVTLTATSSDAYTYFDSSTFPMEARVPIREGQKITLSWEETSNNAGLIFIFGNGLSARQAVVNNSAYKSVTYTAVSGDYFVTFRFGVANSGVTTYYKNIQIEYSDAATTYESPKGTTHTIPFGQTVYGGVLDVLSGVLTVTYGIITYDGSSDENWYYTEQSGTGNKRVFIGVVGIEPATSDIISNWLSYYSGSAGGYPPENTMQVNSTTPNPSLLVGVGSSITSASDWKTYLSSNNLVVVYKLATPIIYQLTPVQVKTLLGQNNIFADTGDISLSYFTQNANAINDIAESNTRTALNTDVPKTDLTDIFVTGTKNNTGSTISAGTYFYVNGQLALCKQAINANADLTLNTNYELVTAGALNNFKTYSATQNGVTYDLFMMGKMGILTVKTGSLTEAVSSNSVLVALTDFSSDFAGKKFASSFQFNPTTDTSKRFDCGNNTNELITVNNLASGFTPCGCVPVVII